MTPSLFDLQAFDTLHGGDTAALSQIGLILLRPPERSWCNDTPVNGHVFATTGGDSVHFCLLEIAGKLGEESPVVKVVPCCSNTPRLVVGDTLRDFLSLGCTIGFFFLEQLVYDFEKTLGYLYDFDAFTRHNYFGEEPPEHELEDIAASKALLATLSKEFDLRPWSDPRSKFVALQTKWAPHIELAS